MDYRYYYENESPARPDGEGKASRVRTVTAFGLAAALALSGGALVITSSIASARADATAGVPMSTASVPGGFGSTQRADLGSARGAGPSIGLVSRAHEADGPAGRLR